MTIVLIFCDQSSHPAHPPKRRKKMASEVLWDRSHPRLSVYESVFTVSIRPGLTGAPIHLKGRLNKYLVNGH